VPEDVQRYSRQSSPPRHDADLRRDGVRLQVGAIDLAEDEIEIGAITGAKLRALQLLPLSILA